MIPHVFVITRQDNWSQNNTDHPIEYSDIKVRVFQYRSLATQSWDKQAKYWMKYYGGKQIKLDLINTMINEVNEYTTQNNRYTMFVVNRWEHNKLLRIFDNQTAELILSLNLWIYSIHNEFSLEEEKLLFSKKTRWIH